MMPREEENVWGKENGVQVQAGLRPKLTEAWS